MVVLGEWEDVEDLEDAGWTTSKIWTGLSAAECVKRAREKQKWCELVWSSSMVSDLQQWSWSEEKETIILSQTTTRSLQCLILRHVVFIGRTVHDIRQNWHDCNWHYPGWQTIDTVVVVQSFSLTFCALFSNNVVGNLLRNIVRVTMSVANLFNCSALSLISFVFWLYFCLLLSFYDE